MIIFRSRMTIVPQEPFLFAGSVRSNLDPHKKRSDSEIWSALRKCRVDDVVRRLGGLDALMSGGNTKDNSNGSSSNINKGNSISISLGQRQLMCLARALLSNSKV